MSQINVNRIKDSNKGAPDFPSGVNVGGITSTVTLGVTNLNTTNVNVSGVVTATTLDGSLLATGTPTLGLGVTINTSGVNISGVATAGIVSATTLYGDGTNITGIALTIAPLNYNPAVFSQSSHIAKASGIGLTFNQAVKAGSGNVTLSLANAGVAGTVVENFGVGNSVTYGDSDYGTTITITPTADLSANQDYHLSYPSGAFTNIGGDVSYVGTAYTFKGRGYIDQLYAWGFNYAGQLGLNQGPSQLANASSPIQIPGLGWNKLSKTSGGRTSLVIKDDNTLWAWGWNNYGEIGNNTRNTPANEGYSSPVQVPGTTWKEVSVSDFSVGAVKTDGTLWAWGANDEGTLAQNDTAHRSSPVQIPGTTWDKIICSEHKMFGIKTNGTLWGWGNNQFGGLGQNQGQNDQYNYSSPVQIPGTTWNKSFASSFSSFATKTNGTLWSWGNNSNGALALNDTAHRSSPVQIPGTTWSTLSNSYSGVNAIKTDGTLWAWGENTSGQLGQNNTTKYSSPVQIPGTTWSKNSFGHKFSAAIKTDGTLWVWGSNGNGNLGQNTTTVYSSPVQIPGTSWSDVDAGYWRALAIKGG